MSNLVWNQAMRDRLAILWDEGHSTIQIGKIMGKTKNAIVGEANRLDLPSRPSPIKKRSLPEGKAAGPVAPRASPVRPARPDRPAPPAPVPEPAPVPHAAPVLPVARPAAPVPAPVPTQVAPMMRLAAPPVTRSARDDCLWTSGDVGAWVKCGARVAVGCFCETHAVLAYVSSGTKAA